MAGHFYPLPPTFIGGRQPYAPKLGIAQSGPPSQPARAFATLGIILASWAQATPAQPKRVQIAPLIPVASVTANPPYTRKQFENVDAAWRVDPFTIISLTSIAPFAEAPADPDTAPQKGHVTLDLIRAQWKAREYLPPQPKGLASLLPPAAIPDSPPRRTHALLKSILDQSQPALYRPQTSKPIAALLPAAAVADSPPPTHGVHLAIVIEQWNVPAQALPRAGRIAALIAPESDALLPLLRTNFETIRGWWEQWQPLPEMPDRLTLSGVASDTIIGLAFDINGSFIPVIDPDDIRTFTPSWVDELPDGVTLVSVRHTVPSPLTILAESNTATTSSVRISGAQHGRMYMVECEATLSNGETMNRGFPLRCFNG